MKKLQVESWPGEVGQLLEITWIKSEKPMMSTLRLPLASPPSAVALLRRTGARGMLRVDPEPVEFPSDRLTVLSNVEGLTAPREIEGRFFSPRSSERSLRAVEGSRGGKGLDHFL